VLRRGSIVRVSTFPQDTRRSVGFGESFAFSPVRPSRHGRGIAGALGGLHSASIHCPSLSLPMIASITSMSAAET
jgi:hypothetical protein